MRQVLEFAQKLVKFYPADAVSYDDASNNRALISGKSALIFNPPSAWAVAKRDAPQVAADCWTFPAPAGPKGRFVPTLSYFWGVYKFSPNKTAAKELIEYLMQPEQVEPRCVATEGYDLPPYAGLLDFKVWEEVEPPKGTVYNYPIRPWHNRKPQPDRGRGVAGHRGADLQPRDPQPDDGAAEGGPDDPAGDRLGAGRAGGLRPLNEYRASLIGHVGGVALRPTLVHGRLSQDGMA